MAPTISIAQGLRVWTLTLEDGSTRTVLGSGIDTVVSGNFPSPVVSAVRGAASGSEGPPPTVGSLNPNTVVLGAASFTLHVIGTNFRPGATIVFAGQDENTTVVSPTEVTTGVNMAFWHGADTVQVSVRSLSGQQSNALPFTFTATAERGGLRDDARHDEDARRDEWREGDHDRR